MVPGILTTNLTLKQAFRYFLKVDFFKVRNEKTLKKVRESFAEECQKFSTYIIFNASFIEINCTRPFPLSL